jgi:hypothetical protein
MSVNENDELLIFISELHCANYIKLSYFEYEILKYLHYLHMSAAEAFWVAYGVLCFVVSVFV